MVYVLMLPALLTFFIFSYIPMTGILMAFNEFRVGSRFSAVFTSQWVGLRHFVRFFESIYFARIVGNTVIINLMKLAIVFPAPILFAVMLNEIGAAWYKKTIQTISYLPSFLSAVVVYGLVLAVLSPTYGFVNSLIYRLGGEPVYFLAKRQYFRWILVFLDVWRYTGWESIIYLAAITSIDPAFYEAAVIDGANRFRRIWHITLPSISELIILLLILRIGAIMTSDFETVILLYSPPVYEVGDVIDTFVFREGLVNLQYSYSAAVGLFKSVVGFALVMGTNLIAKRFGRTGIW
jgi:putative aldouronate transport system permease protein